MSSVTVLALCPVTVARTAAARMAESSSLIGGGAALCLVT